jgi:hypothetical protein
VNGLCSHAQTLQWKGSCMAGKIKDAADEELIRQIAQTKMQ